MSQNNAAIKALKGVYCVGFLTQIDNCHKMSNLYIIQLCLWRVSYY